MSKTPPDPASDRYREMKRKLGKKVASMERQVERLDALNASRTPKRPSQPGTTQARPVTPVRRRSK